MAFLFRKGPSRLFLWCFSIVSAELLILLAVSQWSALTVTGALVLFIVFSGFTAILARHVVNEPPVDLFEILLLMGLGLGVIWSPPPASQLFLIAIFILMILMQLRSGSVSDSGTRWVIGIYGVDIILVMASSFFSPELRFLATTLVYATLLPLFPLHGGYLTLLKRLPGSQPAFLALFLPVLGLYGLMPLLYQLPIELKQGIQFCAILGVTIGGLRCLVQIRFTDLIAQVSLVFWSILWWYLADASLDLNAILMFLSAAALSLSGLLLLSRSLEERYGDLLIDQFSGLSSVMPRFSILLIFFCMASMGLPFFGLFSGLISLSFSASSSLSWGLFCILIAWLMISWRFPTLIQSQLFGKVKKGWVHDDLCMREVLALSLILFVLFVLGVAPGLLLNLNAEPAMSALFHPVSGFLG